MQHEYQLGHVSTLGPDKPPHKTEADVLKPVALKESKSVTSNSVRGVLSHQIQDIIMPHMFLLEWAPSRMMPQRAKTISLSIGRMMPETCSKSASMHSCRLIQNCGGLLKTCDKS